MGDCDGDGKVTVDEILSITRIALGAEPMAACPNLANPPAIDDTIGAVNNALYDCPTIYQLTDGSTLTGATGVAQVTGTLTVVRGAPSDPNALFSYSVAALELRTTDGKVITGAAAEGLGCGGSFGVGCITLRTLSRFHMSVSVVVRIDDQLIQLAGSAPYSGPYGNLTAPPPIENARICGSLDGSITCESFSDGTGGYAVTLFARPDNRID